MSHSIVEELKAETIAAVLSEAAAEVVEKGQSTDDAINYLIRIAEASGLDTCLLSWQDILGSKTLETTAALLTLFVLGWNCAKNVQDAEKFRALVTNSSK